ncbi:MAG: methyltransferase domain-containing protein [Zetaproteobacteria bacterium]|nr:methyltransferase domain-containing protein [Zetaproteobacteria bacterium]
MNDERVAPSGINVRFFAIQSLGRILDDGDKAEVVLNQTAQMSDMDGRDRAFLCELVLGVLRHYFSLEVDVSRFVNRKPPEEARLAMLIGAYQLRYMRVPVHAAVSETVSALKFVQTHAAIHAAKMVNAVLRTLAESSPPDKLKPYQRAELPRWIYQSWRAAWGEEVVQRLAAVLTTQPPLTLAIADAREAWIATANVEGLETVAGEVASTAVLLPSGTSVPALPTFDEGGCWVMDQSAQLPILAAHALLGSVQGLWLDLCASPGGKALLAASLNPEATILAVERSANRLPMLGENIARVANGRVQMVQADASSLPMEKELADVIVLDAPCSASGIFRRHPDAKFLHSEMDVQKMALLQRQLLLESARVLKVGGLLLFSVCSIHPQENEQLFTEMDALSLRACALPPILKPFEIAPGMARLLPSETHDGFFIAMLHKVEQ